MKPYIILVASALLFLGGGWAGYKLKPDSPPSERVVYSEGETKERVVTRNITIKEPSGKEVVESVVTRDVAKRTSEAEKRVEAPSTAPEPQNRVSVSVNPLDRADWSVEYGRRVVGPVWLQGGWQQKNKAVTVGVGVGF